MYGELMLSIAVMFNGLLALGLAFALTLAAEQAPVAGTSSHNCPFYVFAHTQGAADPHRSRDGGSPRPADVGDG